VSCPSQLATVRDSVVHPFGTQSDLRLWYFVQDATDKMSVVQGVGLSGRRAAGRDATDKMSVIQGVGLSGRRAAGRDATDKMSVVQGVGLGGRRAAGEDATEGLDFAQAGRPAIQQWPTRGTALLYDGHLVRRRWS
jgi:hypothetical protein